jgi:hypothetical protein
VAPIAVAAAVVGATAYVGLVDPNTPGHYPLCPTKALTGFDCPFCGGLRAVHALAHGDIGGALNHNALVPLLVVPVLVVLWIGWLRQAWIGPTPTPTPIPVSIRAAEPHPVPDRRSEIMRAHLTEHQSETRLEPRLGTRVEAADESEAAGAQSRRQSVVLWAAVALILVFTVLRNIDAVPAFAWLGSST